MPTILINARLTPQPDLLILKDPTRPAVYIPLSKDILFNVDSFLDQGIDVFIHRNPKQPKE